MEMLAPMVGGSIEVMPRGCNVCGAEVRLLSDGAIWRFGRCATSLIVCWTCAAAIGSVARPSSCACGSHTLESVHGLVSVPDGTGGDEEHRMSFCVRSCGADEEVGVYLGEQLSSYALGAPTLWEATETVAGIVDEFSDIPHEAIEVAVYNLRVEAALRGGK
jgi:hypothetical protein